MRLFTALDLPAELVGSLDAFLRKLKPAAETAGTKLTWSKPENLHITTKFIGEWPEARLAECVGALRGVPAREPLHVHVRRVGFFPNLHSPRSFWSGIEAPGIEALASDTSAALEKLGIEAEKRPFSPHLTLARIKEAAGLQPLREAIAAETALTGLDFGRFEARSFFLYLSQRKPSGAVYTKLAEFPFSST